jgi:hypothetical protein
MMEDAAGYLGHARCLRNLSPAQKRAVIGPFTQDERQRFAQRFFPKEQEMAAELDSLDRLYQMEVPDTSAEFHEYMLTQPSTPGKITSTL